MDDENFGPFDPSDLQFVASLGHLIESRIVKYAKIKYPDSDDEQNYLISLLSQNLTLAMAGYYTSGFPIEEERFDAIDELSDEIQLLKQFDTHQLKKDCNEQKYH